MHSGKHAGLVLPPLFLTTVFCFALVFMQQHQADIRAAAAKQQASTKSHQTLSTPPLKPIDQLQPVITAAPSGAVAGSSSAGIKTSAPAQPSKASGSAVQGAVPNNQPASVIDKVAAPAKQVLIL